MDDWSGATLCDRSVDGGASTLPQVSGRGTMITDAALDAFGREFGIKTNEVVIDRLSGDPDQAPFKGVFSRRSVSLGCGLMASDLIALRTEQMKSTVAGQFVIRLPFQAGDIRIGDTAPKTVSLRPDRALLIAMRSDIHLDGTFIAGRRYTDFFVHIAPGAHLDEALADRIHARMDRNMVGQFVVPHALSARALQICQAEVDDCVQGLLAESCALELLACGIATDVDADAERSKGPAIHAGDRKKMTKIRDHLLAEPQADHRLVDLAREAGICVTSLKAKFQAVFGQSVMATVRDARLDRAKAGITQEGWTVSQAAYRVGYRHQSSFSVAFQRRFGVPPSKLPRA